ncbi:MAG: SPOR domain-containing protein [Acidobacteria bacterium]|nr:MAG: SPOR domain-containing protein [Acidobacteriota bacterium]
MREKLSTRESLAVYGILVAFTLAVFLFGLHIGMNQAGKASDLGEPASEEASPVAKSSPKVDFFEQVNQPRPTRPTVEPKSSTEIATDGQSTAAKRPDVLIASGTAPAQPAFPAPKAGGETSKPPAVQAADASKPAPPVVPMSKTTAPSRVSQPPLTRDVPRSAPVVLGEVFTIQIGAVNSEQEARQLIVRLQDRGYTGILDRPAGTDRFYRVRVGSYPDRTSAGRAERLLKEEGFPTYVKKIQTGGPAR